MKKRGLVNFIFMFAFAILLINFISAESCSVISTDNCGDAPGEYAVLGLSSTTNAHGEIVPGGIDWSSNYPYEVLGSSDFVLCCDFGDGVGEGECTGSNKIIGLSSTANAHAEISSSSNYDYDVCYETLSYYQATGACNPGDIPTISISSDTNAHIANFNYYPIKICGSKISGYCGDGIIDAGEQCDDNNNYNNDGCSHTCQLEDGFTCNGATPTCCFDNGDPSVLWMRNGVLAGTPNDVVSGDVFGMAIYEDFCSPNEQVAKIYKGTYVLGVRVSKTLITTQPIYNNEQGMFVGSWVLSSSDIDSIGKSSNVFFEATFNLGTTGYNYESNVIEMKASDTQPECEPLATTCGVDVCGTKTNNCGQEVICGTCTDAGFPVCSAGQCIAGTCVDEPLATTCGVNVCGTKTNNCGNPVTCGTCNPATETCTGGQCVLTTPTQPCSLDSASWSATATATEGDNITLNAGVSNCDGKTISFEIKENDGVNDDAVTTNPSSQTISTGATSVSALWVAEYQDDTDGLTQTNPPEYYFTATIGSTSLKSSNELKVEELNTDFCFVNAIDSCGKYTKDQCATDQCGVGLTGLQNAGVECGLSFNETTRCIYSTSCGCEWDTAGNICKMKSNTTTSCGVCGNGVLDNDNNEECDDGNTANSDGCSSLCKLESNVNTPCPEGTTLCSDNTCSINCFKTDTDYSNNGCTSPSLDGKQDSCKSGLLCNIRDSFCCNSQSDNKCNPQCAFVDPDCGGINAECGNGHKETGEECDDGNVASNDGCSSLCKLENNIDPINGLCPEGTALCANGKCSINCFATDGGYASNRSLACASGLTFSVIDNACCRSAPNNVCNSNCEYMDPDCAILGAKGTTTGGCVWKENSQDNCDDGFLERDLTAVGIGECNGKNIKDKLVCPAQIKVSFFDKLQFAIAIVVVFLIYFIIKSRIKKMQRQSLGKKISKKK